MWLSPDEVVELWAEVVGCQGLLCNQMTSAETVRRMCRDERFQDAGIGVLVKPMRYYVERESLLDYIAECCAAVRARAEAARE